MPQRHQYQKPSRSFPFLLCFFRVRHRDMSPVGGAYLVKSSLHSMKVRPVVLRGHLTAQSPGKPGTANISRIRIRNSSIAGLPKISAPAVPKAIWFIPLSRLFLFPTTHPDPRVTMEFRRVPYFVPRQSFAPSFGQARNQTSEGGAPGHLPDRPAMPALSDLITLRIRS